MHTCYWDKLQIDGDTTDQRLCVCSMWLTLLVFDRSTLPHHSKLPYSYTDCNTQSQYVLVRSVKKYSCPVPQCTAWKLTSCAPHWKMHGLESTLPVGWCVGMWFDLYTWDLNFIWLWYLFQWYLLNAVIFFHATTTITVRTYIRRWVRLFVLTINFAVLWSNRSKCCFRCMYRICSNKSWAQ